MPTTIVTDLDGVLVDSVQCMLNWVLNRYGVAVPKSALQGYRCEPFVHEVLHTVDRKLYPMITKDESIEEFRALVKENCWRNAEFYVRCQPHYQIYTALHIWARHAQEADSLIGLTSRPRNLGIHEASRRWCALWDLPGMPVIHSQRELPPRQKHLNSKAVFIENLLKSKGDGAKVLYLEDAPEFVLGVAEHNFEAIEKNQLCVVCVDRPWNKRTTLKHGAMRCTSENVAQMVEGLIRQETH